MTIIKSKIEWINLSKTQLARYNTPSIEKMRESLPRSGGK